MCIPYPNDAFLNDVGKLSWIHHPNNINGVQCLFCRLVIHLVGRLMMMNLLNQVRQGWMGESCLQLLHFSANSSGYWQGGNGGGPSHAACIEQTAFLIGGIWSYWYHLACVRLLHEPSLQNGLPWSPAPILIGVHDAFLCVAADSYAVLRGSISSLWSLNHTEKTGPLYESNLELASFILTT